MITLALDTTMGACSAALAIPAKTGGDQSPRIISRYEARAKGHAEAIVPMIAQTMEEAGLTFTDLEKLAVTVGPGTFTGVRIGVATVRGLALATGLPIVGLTSLDVMAHQAWRVIAPEQRPHGIAVAVDARRNELYTAIYEGLEQSVSDPQALLPEDAAHLVPEGICAVGSGATLLQKAADALGKPITTALADLQPSAVALAELAINRVPAGQQVSPLYLRPPDAKPQQGHVLPRQTGSA